MTDDTPPGKHRLSGRNWLARDLADAVIVAGFTLLAFFLRVLVAGGSGIWRDEAQFLAVVRFPSCAAMVDFLRNHESHPPLFYVLMRGWLGAFGDTEAAALAPPIGLGVALVPAVYLVGSRTFSRQAGLICAALVATSPMLVLHSTMVRPYSLMPLLGLGATYWLWRGLNSGGSHAWGAYVVCSLTLLLTHNWAWLVFGSQGAVAVSWLALSYGKRIVVAARGWLLAQLFVIGAYAPWIPTFLKQSRHAGHGPLAVRPLQALELMNEAVTSLSPGVAAVLALTLLGSAVRSETRRNEAGPTVQQGRRLALPLFLGAPLLALAVAAVLSSKNFLLPVRCIITITPCLLLTMAQGATSLSRLPGALMTATFFSLSLVQSVAFSGEIKSNAREVAPKVASRALPGDVLVIEPRYLAASFNYYYRKQNQQMLLSPSGELRGAYCFDDLEARMRDPESMSRLKMELVRVRAEGRRVWLVTDRGILTETVPAGDVLPAMPRGQVAKTRANQIRSALKSLYGVPKTDAFRLEDRKGAEILCVFLYSPDEVPAPLRPRATTSEASRCRDFDSQVLPGNDRRRRVIWGRDAMQLRPDFYGVEDGDRPSPVKRKTNGYLLASLSLVLGTVWALTIRPMDAPDEPSHLQAIMQVRLLCMVPSVHVRFDEDPNGVVVNTPVDPATTRFSAGAGITDPVKLLPYESAQAPLYYLLVGLIASAFPKDPLVLLYLARIVSVAFGAGTIFFCWMATRWLAPDEPRWADATAFMILLLPQFNFNAATAGNDSIVNCAFAVAFATWIRGLREPEYDVWLLRGGAAAGFAVLAKHSGLVLLPGLALVVFFRSRQVPAGRDRWVRLVRMAAAAAGLVAAAAGWWFVRNSVIYGDVTGLRDIVRFHRAHFQPIRADVLDDWGRLLLVTWGSFWGIFGWMNRTMPNAYYLGPLPVTGCLVTLSLIGAARRATRGPRLSTPSCQAFVVMTAVTAGLIVLYLRLNFSVAFQAQARYLFPGILPVGLLLSGGLVFAIRGKSMRRLALGTVLIWLSVLNVAGLHRLM